VVRGEKENRKENVPDLGGRVAQKENMKPGDAAYKAALQQAMRWLSTNANETSESGVVAEVNFVRDCVK
jgi:hypothetical protein